MPVSLRPEARLLRALGHPERLAIVECLRHGPACVCHLTTALHRTQVYVSQQLAILKTAGVIEGRRDGLFIYYHLRDPRVLAVVDSIAATTSRRRASNRIKPRRLEDCDCPQCRPVGRTGGGVQ